LSKKVQQICREIDTVTVKGSVKPVRLFTIDIDINDLTPVYDPFILKSLSEKKIIR